MAYVNIMCHVVWGTKNRFPFLDRNIRGVVYNHILENASSKGIYIDCLNGIEDHIHLLLGLKADLSIAKTVQLIKGESSFWINKEKLTGCRFEWVDEYYAGSVSRSHLDKVRNYISNQEQHHRKISFAEECHQFIKSCDLQLFRSSTAL